MSAARVVQPLAAAGLLCSLSTLIGVKALAHTPQSVGHTSFYRDAVQQAEKVSVLNAIGYQITVPFSLPQPSGAPTKGAGANIDAGTGAFTRGEFDFATSTPATAGTDRFFSIEGPKDQSGQPSPLFAVVAGQPIAGTCPVAVQETRISFFDTEADASANAALTASKGYLVYVSPNKKVSQDAIAKIAQQCNGQSTGGLLVSGQTKAVTVDFKDIYSLLPPTLQQTAKANAFVYLPSQGKPFIYVVNGRLKLN